MWLLIIDEPYQILQDGVIFGYVDSIDRQYIFRVKNNLEPLAIANFADTLLKKDVKL